MNSTNVTALSDFKRYLDSSRTGSAEAEAVVCGGETGVVPWLQAVNTVSASMQRVPAQLPGSISRQPSSLCPRQTLFAVFQRLECRVVVPDVAICRDRPAAYQDGLARLL